MKLITPKRNVKAQVPLLEKEMGKKAFAAKFIPNIKPKNKRAK